MANTPSTVDILVNGSLVGRQQIPAGPFQLGNIIAQAGSNNVTAIVRDAFGRETQVGNSGYYGSPLLLQPGLSTFSVSAGRIRQERVGAGPAYGDFAVMGQGLVGISPNLTAGAAVQASASTRVVAAQVATTNAAGEFSGELAHGSAGKDGGMALALSYRPGTTNWSMSASMTRRQRGFRELAWTAGFDPVLRADDLSVGRNLFGIDWNLRFAARTTEGGDSLRRLSLSAARRWTAQLTTTVEIARTSGSVPDTSMFLLASYMFDPVHSAYVGVARYGGQPNVTVDIVKARQEALSTGYRLASGWTPQAGRRQTLQVVRDTSFGDYELQAGHDGRGSFQNWRASGSVLTVGGEIGVAPPISDAFALVRVPDGPDVPVMLEGRPAGRTGADGTLVVPGLSSYSGQRISIDADALPIDFRSARWSGASARRCAAASWWSSKRAATAPRRGGWWMRRTARSAAPPSRWRTAAAWPPAPPATSLSKASRRKAGPG
ncbi:fimbria/pilus outer membrane usher protein [Ramlibacter terrae]|uniref:Fimbria/pilus outer membrane usher protein n=1 Tax=Ramlibacter terrae TaxID=2732511 RepID=A0ABX6P0Y3_9BURK|nr:fimbria/pilus outer membrane usher protein [Ramlibacter terrae]